MHVLSTPPAFVLSQDQTLHQDHYRRGAEAPSRIRSVKECCSEAPPSTATCVFAHRNGRPGRRLTCELTCRPTRKIEWDGPHQSFNPLFRFQRARAWRSEFLLQTASDGLELLGLRRINRPRKAKRNSTGHRSIRQGEISETRLRLRLRLPQRGGSWLFPFEAAGIAHGGG